VDSAITATEDFCWVPLPLLDSLLPDKFNAGSFVWKTIDEMDDVHGQNHLF